MVIGNNNQNNSNKNPYINPMIENERIKQHTDVNSQQEMNSKAYSMLENRYQNGLITLEEFTKKCQNLRKISK